MNAMKKLLLWILALGLVLGVLPANSIAWEKRQVYLSVSFDGGYINDKNGDPMVYVPVSMEAIQSVDLNAYGLEDLLYDADGDGKYETTALQLLIYAHEELYGGSWSDVDFDAMPGSSYFKDGIFGFTENLVYFLNGDFPVDESQQSEYMTVGATSERIVLEAGDFIDVASFSCYSFLWDQLGGFHLFADGNGNYKHDFAVEQGKTLTVNLKHSFCDLMYGQSWVKNASGYKVYYGKTFGEAEGSAATDSDGNANLSFSQTGTYYLWCYGDHGTDDGTHSSCEYYNETGKPCVVSAPAYAKVTVTGNTAKEETRDVSGILHATMAQLATTVTEPAFGTMAGEWTVFGLARGNYFGKNDPYFTAYYDRIATTVNETASRVNMNGALDKNKSTDNSRLIVALSAIGKDATSVGDWDLVEAYSANGINWIRKQGMNGTIWALIALDSGSYATSDPEIRQKCVDSILSMQHNDGGWSLVTAKAQPSNVDITGMTLTALYPYREQAGVKEACEKAIAWLSESQLDNGGFPYGTGETSESCVWAIVACTVWGIDPDTDPRFIKNGHSAIDNLLTYYVEEEAMFEHGRGAGSNAMATDQACYALVAYDRFVNSREGLFDFSDVEIGVDDTDEISATLSLPAQINPGDSFNGIIGIDQWDNEAGYKLLDFLMTIPKGIVVTDVQPGDRLSGGEISWYVEEETNKLRVVYFDANDHSTLTVSEGEFPAELFVISFRGAKVAGGSKVSLSIGGMSLKLSSDSQDEKSMVIVNTDLAQAVVGVVEGISYSAKCLYTGDDVDLIPSTKKAVAVAVTAVSKGSKLVYDDGKYAVEFRYSETITQKTGVATYVALVDAGVAMENFVNEDHYSIGGGNAESMTFGDTNGDGIVNAQDALAVVDSWLRRGDEPTDNEILAMNVNGDSRINTYDALGVVEAFVNGSEYGVVTKAATVVGNAG